MATEIVMPQLGLTMTEGTVVKWLKKVGERVEKGDALFEVETDKATQEVESLDGGVLEQIVVREGAAVPVGTTIAYLGGGILRSSPAARNLARKLGVEIGALRGSGPGGRIIEADVQRAAESAGPRAASDAPAPLSTAPEPPSASPVAAPVPAPAGEWVELQGIKKIVADRMAQSFSTAPHFYLTVEVDAAELVRTRGQLLSAIQKRHGVELSITDLLVKAVAMALAEHPEANAAWAGDGYRLNQGVNLGVAVAAQEGLVVPVIREADRLSLGAIATRRAALVERARAGRLTLPDLEGGSFTLSNLGMFGIDLFQAIVNPPQAAILAVGKIKDRVVAVGGQPAVRPTMFVTLSSDHRILDGAAAAGFLARVVQLLENPVEMLLAEAGS